MGAPEQSILKPGVAAIGNLALCRVAVRRALDRSNGLPGFVVFYGPSGFGKSFSSNYLANEMRAYYVEAKSVWGKKALLEAILLEMSIPPGSATVSKMVDMVAAELASSRRPLMLDEFDHIVKRGCVEVVRDIYQASGAPILLIGEEQLPNKLKESERVDGRVLAWVAAEPVNLADAQRLREIYARDVQIDDKLLGRIVELARGSVRRVAVNLDLVQSAALDEGLEQATLEWWGGRQLYTGEAPARRRI